LVHHLKQTLTFKAMDNFQNPYMPFSDTTPEEWSFLQQATADLTENQKKFFYMVYSSKRRKSQDLLLATLLGFLGFAGIQRLLVGQIFMGVIYFLTLGFCFIGTIIDVINHKSLANEFNRTMAFESFQIAKAHAA
jgi:TM2 domain-containing membrane protein YozV